MHPSPRAETSKSLVPSLRVCICLSASRCHQLDETTVRLSCSIETNPLQWVQLPGRSSGEKTGREHRVRENTGENTGEYRVRTIYRFSALPGSLLRRICDSRPPHTCNCFQKGA